MAARTSQPTIEDRVDALARTVAALVDALTPAAGAATKAKAHTFATKAERDAGGGFSCACGRVGLRVQPKAGSFHKAPDGTLHTVA